MAKSYWIAQVQATDQDQTSTSRPWSALRDADHP